MLFCEERTLLDNMVKDCFYIELILFFLGR